MSHSAAWRHLAERAGGCGLKVASDHAQILLPGGVRDQNGQRRSFRLRERLVPGAGFLKSLKHTACLALRGTGIANTPRRHVAETGIQRVGQCPGRLAASLLVHGSRHPCDLVSAQYRIQGRSERTGSPGNPISAQSLKLYRRAELLDLKDRPLIEQLYVDPLPANGVLSILMRPNTTFVIGRRGAGKSTVFRRAQHEIRKQKRAVSAYIDIKTVFESAAVDPGLLGRAVAEQRALSLSLSDCSFSTKYFNVPESQLVGYHDICS
jgi:hypothetical protein